MGVGESLLRAGRLGSLEIVLDDSSVSRRHAEVRFGDDGWFVRDLESTNGTYVNGVRIGAGEQPLRPRDIIQFGKVAVIVETERGHARGPAVEPAHRRRRALDASRRAFAGWRSTATRCRAPATS